jgi:hypothetical protein
MELGIGGHFIGKFMPNNILKSLQKALIPLIRQILILDMEL